MIICIVWDANKSFVNPQGLHLTQRQLQIIFIRVLLRGAKPYPQLSPVKFPIVAQIMCLNCKHKYEPKIMIRKVSNEKTDLFLNELNSKN